MSSPGEPGELEITGAEIDGEPMADDEIDALCNDGPRWSLVYDACVEDAERRRYEAAYGDDLDD